MPTPRTAEDPTALEDPHTATEIIGRGEGTRQSKTYLEDNELANILGKIGAYPEVLLRLFRQLHAKHNTELVEVERDDETVIEHQSEVLSDDELREEYPIIQKWERMHREQVAHFASVEGFSVKQATAAPEDRVSGDEESSAGADAPKRANGQASGPRWR